MNLRPHIPFSATQRLNLTGRRGQALVMFIFLILVLCLFVGIGIDVGFAYVTKASMSKAADAAALIGARTLASGETSAQAAARTMFNVNYVKSGRDAGVPTVNVSFASDPTTNLKFVSVSATTIINTYFIRVLPLFKTLTVGASAQAVRSRLEMCLVLDTSGSMLGNGGACALPPAVDAFLSQFDDGYDYAGLVTFASLATVPFPIAQPFTAGIEAAVPRNCTLQPPVQYQGETFADGGLQLASNQLQNAIISSNQSVVKVVIFFTDGQANTFQDTFNCSPPQVLNIVGYDPTPPGSTQVQLLNPADGTLLCWSTDGGPFTGVSPFGCCSSVSNFPSIDGGFGSATDLQAVRTEAEHRALATANALRDAGVTIYAIGLGNDVNAVFLQQLANDSVLPSYNRNQPVGVALIAPTAGQLQGMFQRLASSILLRLVS